MKKEKNLLIIDCPTRKNQHWTLDINTGELYGLKGTPIQTIADGLYTGLKYSSKDGYLQCIGRAYIQLREHTFRVSKGQIARVLQLVDSFGGMGFELSLDNPLMDADEISEIMKSSYWKGILKRLRSLESVKIDLQAINKAMIFCQYYEPHLDDYVTEETCQFLRQAFPYEDDYKALKESDFRGVERLRRLGYHKIENFHFTRALLHYIDLSNLFGRKRQYSSFMDDLAKWSVEEELLGEEGIAELHYKHHLLPENIFGYKEEQFQVVTSKSMADIRTEADTLHHCLYRMYGHRVSRGDFFVVYIRNVNAPDTPFYTLQLIQDGDTIYGGQYYGDYDCHPTSELLEFRDRYLQYLYDQGARLY